MQNADYDYQKEREWAEQGLASSQFNLGNRHELGRDVPQDEKQAAFWYEKAAAQGHLEAKSKLAQLSARISDRKALEDLNKVAAQGNAESQYKLGLMYQRDGQMQDNKQAAFWFEKAAEQGLAKASVSLRHMYSGYGLERNEEKKLFWRQKAAEQGDAVSQTWLGAMYEGGWGGVTRDYEKARFWYEKGAEQGIDKAQYGLEHIYGNGLGISQDLEKAKFWREKAEQTNLLFWQRIDETIARQDALRRQRLVGISRSGRNVTAAIPPPPEFDQSQVDWSDSFDDLDAEEWEKLLDGR